MILATAPGPDQCLFFLSLRIVSRVRREQINNSRSSALLRKRIVMSFFSFFFSSPWRRCSSCEDFLIRLQSAFSADYKAARSARVPVTWSLTSKFILLQKLEDKPKGKKSVWSMRHPINSIEFTFNNGTHKVMDPSFLSVPLLLWPGVLFVL